MFSVHLAGGVDTARRAVGPARQAPRVLPAGYVHVFQPQVADFAVLDPALADADGGKQPHVVLVWPVDVQVGDGVPIPLENPVVLEGRPAHAAVPVVIAGVGAAAAVGVEVQVRLQLVARAAAGAAHAGGRVGEGGVIVGAATGAVPVRVPAHGVQLVQVVNLDQPVVVGVVVHPLPRRRRHAVGGRPAAWVLVAEGAHPHVVGGAGGQAGYLGVGPGVGVGVRGPCCGRAQLVLHAVAGYGRLVRPDRRDPGDPQPLGNRIRRQPRRRSRRLGRVVVDADDEIYGVVPGRIGVAVGVLAVPHEQRDPVAGLPLVVRRAIEAQRPCAGDVEGGCVRAALPVGQRVAVRVGGGVAPHQPRALRHGGRCVGGVEGRRGVGRRAGLPSELLPTRRPVAIGVVLQRRVLDGRPEVPGGGWPVRVDAAGAGGRLQVAGALARTAVAGGLAGGLRVPVGLLSVDSVLVSGGVKQSARIPAGNNAAGIAVIDSGIAAGHIAKQPAHVAAPRHPGGAVGVAQRGVWMMFPDQPAEQIPPRGPRR